MKKFCAYFCYAISTLLAAWIIYVRLTNTSEAGLTIQFAAGVLTLYFISVRLTYLYSRNYGKDDAYEIPIIQEPILRHLIAAALCLAAFELAKEGYSTTKENGEIGYYMALSLLLTGAAYLGRELTAYLSFFIILISAIFWFLWLFSFRFRMVLVMFAVASLAIWFDVQHVRARRNKETEETGSDTV